MKKLVLVYMLAFNQLVGSVAIAQETTTNMDLQGNLGLFFSGEFLGNPVARDLHDLLKKVHDDFSNDMEKIAGEAVAAINAAGSEAEKTQLQEIIANKIANITYGTHRLISGLIEKEENRRLLSGFTITNSEKFLASLRAINHSILAEGMMLVPAKYTAAEKNVLLDTSKAYYRAGGFERGIRKMRNGTLSFCFSAEIKKYITTIPALFWGVSCITVAGALGIGTMPLTATGILIEEKIIEMTADKILIKATAEQFRVP